ncbi:methyl-accepting chemotaxis protein [Zavarzinia marina]|uniref:methyl-accepting chemotaxis protein n=1 Tax=Zavarzinia marina TaxID=2911065 RepID=UPI0022A897D1|nr:methyl-accepting chemotaxis protein [Zavarzinia marina]
MFATRRREVEAELAAANAATAAANAALAEVKGELATATAAAAAATASLAEAKGEAAAAKSEAAAATGQIGAVRGELAALKQMLDAMPVNVMMCELENFNITYVNKTSVETLRKLEHLLPAKADQLIGRSIDIFHKNPSHQRRLLSDPKNLPHRARIKLGDEVLDLLVSPIFDLNGKYTGPMLTWSIITDLVKTEKQTNMLMRMLDDMPINVMTADKDTLEINFINRTSVNTLKAVEHLLPIKAEKALGACIDIFHKNPQHQRRMLADPRNLPHNAKIKLGPETLDLRVSAITDDDGTYIGPMVTWSIVTKTVEVIDSFEQNVKTAVESVAGSANEMRGAADVMSNVVQETVIQSETIAANANEASSNVQTVAAATEELAASVAEIGRQATQSSTVAQAAVAQAEQTNVTVKGLAEASEKIGAVVKLINDIAGQTNLLALNATIEAARAGEAGKGFAVVASEVKNLANQTAKATEEIAGQITAIQGETHNAVGAITAITQTIGQINEIAGAIAAAVEEQGSAVHEISRNVQEAAGGTREVTNNVASLSQATSEAGNAVTQVANGAISLADQAALMRAEVEKFLVEVKKL